MAVTTLWQIKWHMSCSQYSFVLGKSTHKKNFLFFQYFSYFPELLTMCSTIGSIEEGHSRPITLSLMLQTGLDFI